MKLFYSFLFLQIFLATVHAQVKPIDFSVAFVNVNVIPMDKERVLQNQTVLVSNGIITAIGKNVKIPKDAQVVDGRGKYLIPGLVDMHTHLLSDGNAPK